MLDSCASFDCYCVLHPVTTVHLLTITVSFTVTALRCWNRAVLANLGLRREGTRYAAQATICHQECAEAS